MLRRKIVHLKKIYNFDFNHFLIKRTVFVLIVKNVIKNQKFNFPDKRYKARNTEREARRPLGALIFASEASRFLYMER